MKQLASHHRFYIAFTLLMFLLVGQKHVVFAQKSSSTNIQNLQVTEISNSEIRVSVDYYYNESLPTKDIAIFGFVSDAEGRSGTDISEDEVPVQKGKNSAVLSLKMRPGRPDFTTVEIGVCISNPDTAILCENFAYTKNWSVTPASSGVANPPRTPPVMNSVIEGRVSGRLYHDAATEPGGKIERTTLTHVVFETVDKNGRRKSINVKISGQGNFRLTTAPGRQYKIYPGAFQSDPRSITITTQPNVTNRANFRIIGGPIYD